jgi:imidazolonepropionase
MAYLLSNASILTMAGQLSIETIDSAAMAVDDGVIQWLGKTDDVPANYKNGRYLNIDLQGRLVTPGLIDCHTHLVYGGNRAVEFAQRLEGVSYEEISRSGGGIMNTVNATRENNASSLYQQSLPRLQRIASEGATTVEIKSGYGLDSANEIKMLQVAKQLTDDENIGLQSTFLGAHALPPEFKGRDDAYIDLVCESMLPAAIKAGVVDAVDAFCEGIAFSVSQVERVFDVAEHYKLPVKCHAEQLSNLGGSVMASRHGALSVDHIEFLDDKDVAVLADNNTVAVLLPGAFYVLKETQLPPLEALRAHGVRIALATDCNPGSSPVTSLLLIMNMACTLFRMTPTEALAGVTINAAYALGLEESIGSIEVGKQADLAIYDVSHPAELAYNVGLNPCVAAMRLGNWRFAPNHWNG